MSKTVINILTPQTVSKRGFNDFFPIIKWKKNFKEKGVHFKFFDDHHKLNDKKSDILILDYRYSQRIEKQKGIKLAKQTPKIVFDIIYKQKLNGTKKIVFFDTRDSAGSESLDLLPHVDLFLKKQMYVDKKLYLYKKEYNFMVWLPPGYEDTRDAIFKPALENELYKMKIGWNIGLCDFRVCQMISKLPVYWIPFNNLLIKLKFNTSKLINRNILTTYRGTSNLHPSYDYQRNLAKSCLQSYSSKEIILGDKIKKTHYLKELENSKCVLSPFGWGEICYRDFETVLNGSLLIKPNMSHIETYPDYYQSNKTFIEVDWQFLKLSAVLDSLSEGVDYSKVVENFQNKFKFHQNNFYEFYEHIYELLLS